MTDISLHIAVTELCENVGIEQSILLEVVEYGIAQPISKTDTSQWIFDLESAYWIKKAVALNQELLLDWVAISFVIDLMKEKEMLARENELLKSRLDRLL